MLRYYYSNEIEKFLIERPESILGILAQNNQFDLNELQRNSWIREIDILKKELVDIKNGVIIFEYTIPRIGNRIDNILLYQGYIFLLEFKVGEEKYIKAHIEQLTDYALNLKNFHKETYHRKVIPLLIATEAPQTSIPKRWLKNGIHDIICCNQHNLREAINQILRDGPQPDIAADHWINSIYTPTPTIIEAAQALYRNHAVSDISRNDAKAINLSLTTEAINSIINQSKKNRQKSICFITGVPGSGKTLAGLNIANTRLQFNDDEHTVFLSGNGPLVSVLQEALARDESFRKKIKKSEALIKSKAFIQNIHHFRDDAITTEHPPVEKVVIFDEAQRAWNKKSLCDFMARKKGVLNFQMSEPDFLISIMNRHIDWAVIICLVGEGQEINKGEAGMQEWFDTLSQKYKDWKIFISNETTNTNGSHGQKIKEFLINLNHQMIPELHLSTSLRSFRSENVSHFIQALLDADFKQAKKFHQIFKSVYPVILTRDINEARLWIKEQAKGSERYGLIAHSNAIRLKAKGVHVQNKIDARNWFLNKKSDTRSSYYLEDAATEFDVQGLELDWALVAWDANMRIENGEWKYYSFKGTMWSHINNFENVNYLRNSYRVLLTRARQGMAIYIPYGDKEDETRNPEWYDTIYNTLKSVLFD